ncbi:MAG: epoxyqueuosine reductase QueH [Opitutales bacterium]|nr:epoxyqueuosine reductase QueH [Opitutales bacterium]
MQEPKKIVELNPPFAERKILLHACCAPCSLAILECLLQNGFEPVVFYFNPNIFPHQEYEKRKAELTRHCKELGVEFIDGDCGRDEWLAATSPYKCEPERGARCLECFKIRLCASAKKAGELGLKIFTTTLSSSRWKSFGQICAAAKFAEEKIGGAKFWDFNWKKFGLSERRAELLKSGNYYNQTYCGCEYSMRNSAPEKSV